MEVRSRSALTQPPPAPPAICTPISSSETEGLPHQLYMRAAVLLASTLTDNATQFADNYAALLRKNAELQAAHAQDVDLQRQLSSALANVGTLQSELGAFATIQERLTTSAARVSELMTQLTASRSLEVHSPLTWVLLPSCFCILTQPLHKVALQAIFKLPHKFPHEPASMGDNPNEDLMVRFQPG